MSDSPSTAKINHIFHNPNDVIPAIKMSKAGDRTVYYEGFLQVATNFDQESVNDQKRQLLFMAEQVYLMALAGDVHLVQKKKSDSNYIYMAEKATEDYHRCAAHKRWVDSHNNLRLVNKAVEHSKLVVKPKMGRPSNLMIALNPVRHAELQRQWS